MKDVLMRTSSYHLDIMVERKVADVFSFFCDLRNHVHLHPLLTNVTVLTTSYNAKGQEVTTFKIEERITIVGNISIPNTYYADSIILEEQKTCIFEVKSFPKVYLSSSYTFLEEKNGTKIQEKVRIKTPIGLANFVTKTAKKAHQSLLVKLKEHLEK